MFTGRSARFVLVFASLLIVLTQARGQTEFPPAYNNQAHYAVGDLVTDYGNIYRCEAAVTKPYLDPSKTYQNWELFYVRSGTTIPIGVGQTFPTLAIAWNYVRNARVATAAYLHLSIVTTGGSFGESFSAPLSLDMDTGSQVSIIGDSGAISLNFPNTSGLTIDSGHSFGSISSIALAGGSTSDAVYAGSNASITNLSFSDITGFNYQIYAEQSAQILCGEGMVLTNTFNYGCYATNGGSIQFNAPLYFTGSIGSGDGLEAIHGGRIVAQYANITGGYNGAYAAYGGIIQCDDSTFKNCSNACQAVYGGNIKTEGSTFTASTNYDLSASYLGFIDAYGYAGTGASATNGGVIFAPQ